MLLPVGLPLLPLTVLQTQEVISVSGDSAGAREHASVSSTPLGAEDPGAACSRRSPVARSAPLLVGSPRSSLHNPRGGESGAPLEARSHSQSPVLPSLLAEKPGRIVEPAPGRIALVTGLVVRSLAPLPEVKRAVGGARLGRLLPVKAGPVAVF